MSNSDWPIVAVCIITYDRLREIKLTIRALQDHLTYTGPLAWHLADDASPQGYLGQIMTEFPQFHFTYTATKRKGWGANANAALYFLRKYPYVFLIEDDYVAKRDLNITQGVAIMEAEPSIALVRYDGIAGHALDLHLREVETKIGKLQYCTIDHNSPHLNIYSNRPHLKHTRFHGNYGWYAEGQPLGETESKFAHTVKDKANGPKLAVLADGIFTAFEHIGVSRQGSAADKETWK